MNVVIAIDSFKGSLSSSEAGKAAAAGVLRAFPDATPVICPIADGGEGTVEAVTAALGGRIRCANVSDPLGRPVKAAYGLVEARKLAIIEMAAAAGLPLLPPELRNPAVTTTYGVGELILDAIKNGCRRFIVGIGGSATNDGGVGMLEALGVRFTDAEGKPVPRGAQGLSHIAHIDVSALLPTLADCRFRIACDVKNPLCGENGCSAVYGPQKGAAPHAIPQMDAAMAHFAACTRRINPKADPDFPGAGAAGGLGFGFLSYLHAELTSGIGLVMEETALEEKIRTADVVVTGEGRLDGQSVMGKVPAGVAALAKKHGKTVLALAGCVADDAVLCNAHGIDAFFPILRRPCSLEEAMDTATAAENLTAAAEQVFRLWHAARK